MKSGMGFVGSLLLVWATSATAFAAPHDTRERARRRQAAERAQPRPTPLAVEPEFGEVHLALGVGGGNVGAAARIGADFEYWALPTLGVGALVAGVTQAGLFSDSISYWMVGPALTVRERPAGNLFMTLGLGYSALHWQQGWSDVDDGRDHSHSLALQFQVGALSSGQALQFGGAVCVDAVFVPAHLVLGSAATALTLNFTLAASLH
jgi:hypothetical protein